MLTSTRVCDAITGRHDNDYKKISQIPAIPTENEIRDGLDHLPSPLEFSQQSPKDVECIYDTFFRLYRHDAIGEVEQVVKTMLLECSAPDKWPNQGVERVRIRHPNTRVSIYPRARVSHMRSTRKHGLEAQIRFQAPVCHRQKSNPRHRQRFEEGVLLCLITFHEGRGVPMFFTVSERDIDPKTGHNLVAENESMIYAKPTATTMAAHNLMALATSFQSGDGFLAEFPGVLPATFVPVLENLQKMFNSGRSGLVNWLLESSPGHPIPSMPPPAYAQVPGFKFDLSPIVIDPAVPLSFEPGADMAYIEEELERSTRLDEGQCRALLAGLSRELALIQGPPGTGKSYVGTQLVRVLLANKSQAAFGPIIVICHTNHALDQFLENLISAGVEDVVRIGGNGTSSLLGSKNLRSISKQCFRSRSESYELSSAFKAREASELALLDYLESASRVQNPDWRCLRAHLRRNYDKIYQQFLSPAGASSEAKSNVAPFDLWLATHKKTVPEIRKPHTSSELETVLSIAKRNVNHLTLEDRSTLVNHWVAEMGDSIARDVADSLQDMESSRTVINCMHEEIDRRILATTDVIGLTTTGLAKNASLLRSIDARVLLCEEAAEVLEAHMLGAFMPSVQHLILIGDHEQLRPQITNFDLFSMDSAHGKQYSLDRGLFERLACPSIGQPQLPVTQLNVQRRMRPEISELIRNTLYPRLVDHPDTERLPNVRGMGYNLFWYHHTSLEANSQHNAEGKSHSNEYEVQVASALVHHIVRQGMYSSNDIAVLTPYAGQLQKLRRKLSEHFTLLLGRKDKLALVKTGSNGLDSQLERSRDPRRWGAVEQAIDSRLKQVLRIATIDNFQGEEAKIVQDVSRCRAQLLANQPFRYKSIVHHQSFRAKKSFPASTRKRP